MLENDLVNSAGWLLWLMQPFELTMEYIGGYSHAETSNTCMYSGQSQHWNASRKCHLIYINYCFHCILAFRSPQTANENSVLQGADQHLGLLRLMWRVSFWGSCFKNMMLSFQLKPHDFNGLLMKHSLTFWASFLVLCACTKTLCYLQRSEPVWIIRLPIS